MLKAMLVLILVVIDMVAIIVNRKSLLACITIVCSSVVVLLGVLALYENADKFRTYQQLSVVTVIFSAVVIVALLAVTYIGVKMHFKNLRKTGKTVSQPTEPIGEPRLIPGTNIMAKAVGIFGRQPIERHETPAAQTTPVTAPTKPVTAPVQTQTHVATPVQQPTAVTAQTTVTKTEALSKDAQLARMLEKAESFKRAGQYVLAEQMYVTYIKRCPDNSSRADGELLMLDCRIKAGNVAGSEEQLADLLGKLRSGEYALTQDQKKALAECKMNLLRLKAGN